MIKRDLARYLRQTVRTPKGEGVLVQLFQNRASVSLHDQEDVKRRQVTFFHPDEVEVID